MAQRWGIFRTIPAWDIKDEDYYKKKMLERFEVYAQDNLHMDYHIREIEDIDFDRNDWQLPLNQDMKWGGTLWIQHLLTQHEAMMIYGVTCITEVLPVRKLIFRRGFSGATIIGRNDLTPLKSLEPALEAIKQCHDQQWLRETFGDITKARMEGYFQEPYFYRPQEGVWVGVVYFNGAKTSELKLNGYVAEVVGKSIA